MKIIRGRGGVRKKLKRGSNFWGSKGQFSIIHGPDFYLLNNLLEKKIKDKNYIKTTKSKNL